MTDTPTNTEKETETETSTAPKQTEPAQPAPTVDTAALASQVTEKVTEQVADVVGRTVEEKVTERFRAVAGVEDKKEKEVHPRHSRFVADPEGYERDIEERVEARLAQRNATVRDLQGVTADALQKYPDLQKFPNEINADYAALEADNPNLSKKEIMSKALARTAERLDLQELSEDQQADTFLPPASGRGYAGGGENSNPEREALDFVKALREGGNKLRRRAS